MNRKAVVFSIEALISLLVASTFLLFVLPQETATGFGYQNVYRYELLQDVFEVTTRNQEMVQKVVEFSKGSDEAKNFLQEEYAEMLGELGSYCLTLEARGRTLEANCETRGEEDAEFIVSGTRTFFDGDNNFFEAQASLAFK